MKNLQEVLKKAIIKGKSAWQKTTQLELLEREEDRAVYMQKLQQK